MWFLNLYLQYGLIWVSVVFLPLILLNWIVNEVINFRNRRKSMQGKVVLITGAGNGIGRELACQLAEQGCLVLCVDINSEENEKTIKLIQNTKTKNLEKITPISYQCDISDKIAVRILAKEVLNKYQKVDILINNAGVSYPNPLLKITDVEIEKLFQINLLSHFWTIQAFLPSMKQNQSGMIVATSSASAMFPTGNLVAYSASKGGVTGLMGALYHELRLERSPIKTLTVHPGFTATNLMPENLRKPQWVQGVQIVSPQWMAQQILKAIKEGRRSVIIPSNQSIVLYVMDYILPEWFRHYILQYLFDTGKFI